MLETFLLGGDPHWIFSFAKGLSLEDGAATLTEYTAKILAFYFNTDKFVNRKNYDFKKILTCGGGRKNNFLIESLQKKINQPQIT